MNVRKAIKKDAESIIHVINESVLNTHKDLYPREDIEETLNNYTLEKVLHYINDYDYFVAEEDSKIIGCVLGKEDKMRSLYVLPTFMGKGFGRELVKVVEEKVKERGYKKIWLWSSLIAHDFYKHMGYTDVKEIPNKEGLILHIEMKRIFD